MNTDTCPNVHHVTKTDQRSCAGVPAVVILLCSSNFMDWVDAEGAMTRYPHLSMGCLTAISTLVMVLNLATSKGWESSVRGTTWTDAVITNVLLSILYSASPLNNQKAVYPNQKKSYATLKAVQASFRCFWVVSLTITYNLAASAACQTGYRGAVSGSKDFYTIRLSGHADQSNVYDSQHPSTDKGELVVASVGNWTRVCMLLVHVIISLRAGCHFGHMVSRTKRYFKPKHTTDLNDLYKIAAATTVVLAMIACSRDQSGMPSVQGGELTVHHSPNILYTYLWVVSATVLVLLSNSMERGAHSARSWLGVSA